MVLSLIASQKPPKSIEHSFDDQYTDESSSDSLNKRKKEAKELNQMIKHIGSKLPQSDDDEYESKEASHDSTTKTINNK